MAIDIKEAEMEKTPTQAQIRVAKSLGMPEEEAKAMDTRSLGSKIAELKRKKGIKTFYNPYASCGY